MYPENDFDRRIEEQNTKIAHVVWTIFVSMMTSIIVTLAATGQLERLLPMLR